MAQYTLTESVTLVTEVCITCGVTFAVPKALYDWCRKDPSKEFYCPNGHSMVFRKSILQQEIEKLKKENEEAERARYSLHNQLSQKEQEVKKLQTSIKRRNKRIAAGVCPCCNRTVNQLAEHIKTMHPEIANIPIVNEIHKKINAK